MTARQQLASVTLQSLGYSREGAAALVGNFSQEVGINLPSSYRPTAELDHGSQCLPQWRLERLVAFENWCAAQTPPLHTGAINSQLRYVAVELVNAYPKLDAALKAKRGNVETLAARVCWEYERPAVAAANLANRVKQAKITFAETSPADLSLSVEDMKSKSALSKASAGAAVVVAAGGVAAHLIHGLEWAGAVLIAVIVAIGALAAFTAWKHGHNADALSSALNDLAAKKKALDASLAAEAAQKQAIAANIIKQQQQLATAAQAEAAIAGGGVAMALPPPATTASSLALTQGKAS